MSKITYKVRHFLHDQVTAEIFPFRNQKLGSDADELEAQLAKALGKAYNPDDARYGSLCTLLVYTKSLTFKWLPDAPEEWRALEGLWALWKKRAPIIEVWEFMNTEYFDATLIYGWFPNDAQRDAGYQEVTGWLRAFNEAMIPWSPISQRPREQLSPEEQADPN